ncbi:MAG: DUF1292 domain-containing protein [Clostridia bacterium]|nr:DUF1292 domain-containing protein [Clostridia bacterium]
MFEEAVVGDVYTLTDEDGVEQPFTLIGKCTYEGGNYFAFQSASEDDDDEGYVILRVRECEDGDMMLDTVDDEDEFDAVADIFEDEIFFDIDYDEDDET